MEGPCHPSVCRFEDCEGWVKRPSQWSNSIKAGLCALFDEGCVKHHWDVVKLTEEKGEGIKRLLCNPRRCRLIKHDVWFSALFSIARAACFTWRLFNWSVEIQIQTLIAVSRVPVSLSSKDIILVQRSDSLKQLHCKFLSICFQSQKKVDKLQNFLFFYQSKVRFC